MIPKFSVVGFPKIRRAKGNEALKGKWMTYNRQCEDISSTFKKALRMWFWYMGLANMPK